MYLATDIMLDVCAICFHVCPAGYMADMFIAYTKK